MISFKKIRQLIVEIGDGVYYRKLAVELKTCDLVLDVGCGSWSPLSKVKKHFYAEGIDIHKPSLEKANHSGVHDKYRLGDVNKIDEYYQAKSFDAVIALDLIEHLSKSDGLKLIKKMEKIARKKVILLTPNGFIRQDPLKNNPYQVHQSGWRVSEFSKLGYRVYGMRGLKLIRGEWATIKFKPWLLWGVVSVLSQMVVYYLPGVAYQLFVVKNLKTFYKLPGSSSG